MMMEMDFAEEAVMADDAVAKTTSNGV